MSSSRTASSSRWSASAPAAELWRRLPPGRISATAAQAEALDELLDQQGVRLDAVVSYELPLEEIVGRLGGRRTCSKCKAVFHATARPPLTEGICDLCGGSLIQREDDRPESIRVRMQAYEVSTRPLADYYRRTGRLVAIAADGTPEAILETTPAALQRGRLRLAPDTENAGLP